MLHSAPCFILVDVCRFDAYEGKMDIGAAVRMMPLKRIKH